MKKIIVILCMVCIVSPLIPTEGDSVEQIEADNKLFVMYDKLQQRLARMPQLLTMFEQLHSAQVRGDYEKYVDHRYEFDAALKKYELAPGLIRALHRFNNSMAPHKKIAWWKRKGVMIPLALAVAAAGLFAGVQGIRYKEKADEALVATLEKIITSGNKPVSNESQIDWTEFGYSQADSYKLPGTLGEWCKLRPNQRLSIARTTQRKVVELQHNRSRVPVSYQSNNDEASGDIV